MSPNSKRICQVSAFAFGGVCLLLGMSCAAAAEETDVRAIQRTYRELRAFDVPDDVDVEDHEIPPRIRLLQTKFKHQARALITSILDHDVDSMSMPPSQISVAIRNRFKSFKLITRTKEHLPFFSFGHVLDVSVSRPPEHPDFLVVGVVVDGGWDEDESLYIFQHQPTGWVNLLAAEVNGYKQVWDAQSVRFNYAVSPTAPDGSWFLVTSSINPHMASAWQLATYTALRPGPDVDHPKILVRRTHSIYLDTEDEGQACRIKVTVSGFRVSFRVGVLGESLADERYSDEYRVADGLAKQVAVRCRTRNRFGERVACDAQGSM